MYIHDLNQRDNLQNVLNCLSMIMPTLNLSVTGKVELLKSCGAEKTLALKVGAPVILIRNLQAGMFNGSRGIVHSLEPNKAPIVNINGRLIVAEKCRFEVYDPKSKSVLASRTQYPFKLAYGLTVHRAQGQTVDKLEIDCYSFFAPGQMGVAVGRAVRISGLRIINYNSAAAHLKHPQVVYDFYQSPSAAALDDLSCCRNIRQPDAVQRPGIDSDQNDRSSDRLSDQPPTYRFPSLPDKTNLTSPYRIQDFIQSHNTSTFVPENISNSFLDHLQTHSDFLYSNLKPMMQKRKKSKDDIAIIYTDVNDFLTSSDHQLACMRLSESPKPQKLSTKLFLWLLDSELKKAAELIVSKDESKLKEVQSEATSPSQLSSAASSKIRHLAGACLHKIISRMRSIVSHNLGKSSVRSRTQRDWGFKLHRLLKGLRVSEETVLKSTTIPESMYEIEFRQGPSRGLMHVSDDVYLFFCHLHIFLQQFLSAKAFHVFDNRIHLICRQKLLKNEDLKQKWTSLFAQPSSTGDDNDDEDDTFNGMTDELYGMVTEHYLRISIAESLHMFKTQIPKTKKQALRSKVTALGERDCKKKKKVISEGEEGEEEESKDGGYCCPVCNLVCLDSPVSVGDNSICCDACNKWFHFKCVKLHGSENFLKRSVSTWKCPKCKNRKDRGKKLK